MREIQVGDIVFIDYSSWQRESLQSTAIARFSGIEAFTASLPPNQRIAKITYIDDISYSVEMQDKQRFAIPKQFARLLENVKWD